LDRFLVVAEEAGEGRGERFALVELTWIPQTNQQDPEGLRTFLGP